MKSKTAQTWHTQMVVWRFIRRKWHRLPEPVRSLMMLIDASVLLPISLTLLSRRTNSEER